MSKSYPRNRRVGDQIQRTLSDLLRREVRDPRLGSVTVTDVRVAPDLSHAKVFYSVLGGNPNPTLTQEILNSATPILRGPLGRALRLRHAPQLEFAHDTLIESGARMTELIRQAVQEDTARHKDDDAQ
jgi:ribosome-binding factor A